jgi:ketosteroid isomerase-like protein
MKRASILRSLTVLVLLGSVAGCAQASDADREAEVLAALDAFYGAIGAGDADGAMRLIAPGAIFVESGMVETRDQYEQNHLPRDIDFEGQITGVREIMRMGVDGNLAWVLARTHYDGTFDDFPLEFDSLQLTVLSHESGEWLIESVHWSSL